LHLTGDLFELYDDARTYKPEINQMYVFIFSTIFVWNISHSKNKDTDIHVRGT